MDDIKPPSRQKISSSSKSHNGSSVEKKLKQARRKVNKTNRTVWQHIQHFLIDRWDHLRLARHDVVVWLVLIIVLIGLSLFQTIWYNNDVTISKPANGGIYAEGVVDKLSTINPLYVSTDSEKAASQLVYPGLLAYDDTNSLTGNLAESWSVDDSGKIWTVRLKPDIKWADGHNLTADDVVFTLGLIKDDKVNSPLRSSWLSTNVKALNKRELQFTLEAPYVAFPTTLTFGILPKHILANISATEIGSLFNKTPEKIPGSGMFQYKSTESTNNGQSIWRFSPNEHYFSTKPRIDQLTIRTYSNSEALVNGFKRGEINVASEVGLSYINQLNNSGHKVLQIPTADGVFAMFNNSGEITADKSVRQALRLALNRDTVRAALVKGHDNISTPLALETPIANGVYDSIDQLKQPEYNQGTAEEMLTKAGWLVVDGKQYRQKGDQELTLNIVTIAGTNYEPVADLIAEQWRQVGVNAKVTKVDPATAQQNYLLPRNYDVLVYQLHIGADPDEYAYWSSNQDSSSSLNFANYNSRRAEIALAAGRSNPNRQARESRYVTFVNQWLDDAPAIALYQPSLYYVMDNNINTLDPNSQLIDASMRFRDANTWTVRTSAKKNTV